ncbi:MAG: carbamoyl phosphate synthase [Saprospiraceae bacterium]|nr:MAG: carbamoyl phosphate synthase [Saprospiraceae bacterium]
MKKNLLLSGLGGSLFPYLHHYLQRYYHLFYVDSNQTLSQLYPGLNFFHSPLVTEKAYESLIKEIISSHKIHYYIPLIDEEILFAKNKINGFHDVHVISPQESFVKLCLNKFDLMNKLRDASISNVESYTGANFNWEIKAPIFIKPITGRGSRGIRKIKSPKELNAYYELEPYQPEEIIIQPFLEGTEYTVGVLVNNVNKAIAISSKRIISKKGITIMAVTENNKAIDEVVLKIVDKLKPGGPFNVQLILTPDSEVKIFEINPRFSTTSIMEFEGGLDLFSLYIGNLNQDYQGDIQRPKSGLVLHRRWENCFYEAN